MTFSARITLCAALLLSVVAHAQQTVAPPSVTVPLSYESPELGHAKLLLDYAAPFDRSKPTVLVIADGQQFYVRVGAMKELQQNTFGNGVNVVGIVTRGTTQAFVNATLDRNGKPDWPQAWKVFNSAEWIGDIESVRKALVGEQGRIELYGRSGGAYLVHQYLSLHADHVNRAFTQSAVTPLLNAELGIALDTYWSDLGRQDPVLQKQLLAALAAHPKERIGILMTLQRQHFFVSADQIASARAKLIRALGAGNMDVYRAARKEYQVDDMAAMYASTDIIPQDVRVLELIEPSGAFSRLGDGGLYPLTETQGDEIQPLLKLQHSGAIQLPPFDFAALHHCQAEVFVLAGRYDEAVDYRTEIALASSYPRHNLFIADDNHVFSKLSTNGTLGSLVSAFLTKGFASKDFRSALSDAEQFRWREE